MPRSRRSPTASLSISGVGRGSLFGTPRIGSENAAASDTLTAAVAGSLAGGRRVLDELRGCKATVSVGADCHRPSCQEENTSVSTNAPTPRPHKSFRFPTRVPMNPPDPSHQRLRPDEFASAGPPGCLSEPLRHTARSTWIMLFGTVSGDSNDHPNLARLGGEFGGRGSV
jgi:hypothetical protein